MIDKKALKNLFVYKLWVLVFPICNVIQLNTAMMLFCQNFLFDFMIVNMSVNLHLSQVKDCKKLSEINFNVTFV